MIVSGVVNIGSELQECGVSPARAANSTAWSFIYIFFTNGIPFDSPNRSEPCPFP